MVACPEDTGDNIKQQQQQQQQLLKTRYCLWLSMQLMSFFQYNETSKNLKVSHYVDFSQKSERVRWNLDDTFKTLLS